MQWAQLAAVILQMLMEMFKQFTSGQTVPGGPAVHTNEAVTQIAHATGQQASVVGDLLGPSLNDFFAAFHKVLDAFHNMLQKKTGSV
jgi:hypothetical protein